MSKQEKQPDAIRFVTNVQKSFRGMKLCMIICASLCAVVVLSTNYSANQRADAAAKNIYVIDQGSVLEAHRADNKEQLDLEVIDHVSRFHEIFFNLAPNINLINQNVSRALELADKSAYQYFNDLSETKYYSRLIEINAVQQIAIDSVSVNMEVFPYQAITSSHLYVLRESNISSYELTTSCEVINTERTTKNPHGLMMINFHAESPKFLGTVRR